MMLPITKASKQSTFSFAFCFLYQNTHKQKSRQHCFLDGSQPIPKMYTHELQTGLPCSKSSGRDSSESREASGCPLMLAPVQRESHKSGGESSLQRTLWKLGQDLNNTQTSQKALRYLKIWRTKTQLDLQHSVQAPQVEVRSFTA